VPWPFGSTSIPPGAKPRHRSFQGSLRRGLLTRPPKECGDGRTGIRPIVPREWSLVIKQDFRSNPMTSKATYPLPQFETDWTMRARVGVRQSIPATGETTVIEPELAAPPAGHEARIRRIRTLARLLDNAFGVPGTNWRFGWDSLIGLIPGGGDLATALLASYIVAEAAQLGVPRRVLWRMLANIAIDLAGGAVPFAGDVFDFAFKANRKNLKLVEKHLERREAER